VYNGGVVFTSNRKNVEWVDNSHSWTGKQFFRIYFAQGAEASFSSPTLFAGKLQTKYHDGPVSFNKTGNIMYFTRNNIEDGKKRTDDKQITRLKIYSTNYADGKWGIEVPMTFNNDNYSVAHPSLSADSKTLYFSSDMPGGQGGMDIWKTEWNGSAWGVPSNLGTTINTPGNEIFPFVAEDGTLLFSSDGLPGIGGLDLFQTSSSSGKWMKPENMGAPLNSSYDDFGVSFILTSPSLMREQEHH